MRSSAQRPDKEAIRRRYTERRPLLEEAATAIERETVDLLREVPHVDRVYFRAKGITSFVDKACQIDDKTKSFKYVTPFDQLEDQIAGRVLVFFLSDIEIVSRKLGERFHPVEAKRKQPEQPNAFDYESQHFVFRIPLEVPTDVWKTFPDMPKTFEMQVRTLFMHAWAEPQHDLGYKGKELSVEGQRELAWAAASAWGADQVLERLRERVPASSPGEERQE